MNPLSPAERKLLKARAHALKPVVAIGNESNPLIRQTTEGLKTNKWGNIIVDETGKTSIDRVYAGGDIVLGAATVILAMGEGRRAAASINAQLATLP